MIASSPTWLIIASANLAVAVALGAFGAHALKQRISDAQLQWWQVATEYYFYHALGLLIIGIFTALEPAMSTKPAWLLQAGIIFFCGSLYAMALGAPRWFGAITPIGGVLFILGWLLLAYWGIKTSTS